MPLCQQGYSPARGLGRADSYLCREWRRELSPAPEVEPSGAPGRTASYRAPGVGASTAPTARTGGCRGGLPRLPPVTRVRAAARACRRSRASSASASRSLVRSLCCSSRSQRCSSPLVCATRAYSAIFMPGVFCSRTVARAACWTSSTNCPLIALPVHEPELGVEAAETLGEGELVIIVPLYHDVKGLDESSH